jgi:hypothetical protein
MLSILGMATRNVAFVNSFAAWKENQQCPRHLKLSAP